MINVKGIPALIQKIIKMGRSESPIDNSVMPWSSDTLDWQQWAVTSETEGIKFTIQRRDNGQFFEIQSDVIAGTIVDWQPVFQTSECRQALSYNGYDATQVSYMPTGVRQAIFEILNMARHPTGAGFTMDGDWDLWRQWSLGPKGFVEFRLTGFSRLQDDGGNVVYGDTVYIQDAPPPLIPMLILVYCKQVWVTGTPCQLTGDNWTKKDVLNVGAPLKEAFDRLHILVDGLYHSIGKSRVIQRGRETRVKRVVPNNPTIHGSNETWEREIDRLCDILEVIARTQVIIADEEGDFEPANGIVRKSSNK